MSSNRHYEAVAIGASSGGLVALEKILSALPGRFPLPIFIVQHISPKAENYLPQHFGKLCRLQVKEVDDKEIPQPGVVYFAPANYHLLLEFERTLALSTEERVNFSRPSIDILFATAAEAYREQLIGIILTGANADGAQGLKRVREYGGLTIVQRPETAEAPAMPKAAMEATPVDHILSLAEIGRLLHSLALRNDTA
jgi:two-component system, chemotaxis family, protein-glutamate methylesterase/glutaminase